MNPSLSPASRTLSKERADSLTPAQALNLCVVDPACGSGSFLLGAYQYLLDWHLNYYLNHDPQSHTRGKNPPLVATDGGEYRLTTETKKRILTSNIYGVDIDAQAVEVTKLSLLLKLLEGETGQLALGFERVLPDLGQNIRCGNSLIGSDYFDETLFPDEEEHILINPFDWRKEFPAVFANGGFDAVIGNPPYIQLSMADYYNPNTTAYFLRIFKSSMGRFNTFAMFIHIGILKLLREDGLISFIVPNTILTQEGYTVIRDLMLHHSIINITSFTEPVFKDAVVETVIFVVKKEPNRNRQVKIVEIENREDYTFKCHTINQEHFSQTRNNIFLIKVDEKGIVFKNKLVRGSIRLGEIVNINQAIALKSDRSKSLSLEKLGANFKPVLDGRNIHRYQINWDGYFLAYDIKNIHSCKRTDIFEANEKIFFRRVGDRIIATLDEKQYYALNTLVVVTTKNPDTYNLRYILGLLNSTLFTYYYVTYLKSSKKVFSEIQARQIADLPIKKFDDFSANDKHLYDKLVNKVNLLLRFFTESPVIPSEYEQLERAIKATDAAIDHLVYELYGLSNEEIRMVESNY